MDLIVAAKYVPEVSAVSEETWDRERGTLKRQMLPMVFNPLDRRALRLAFELRGRLGGGRVTVISMGPPQAARMLREALAHGADRAVLLTDPVLAGSDTLATARALVALIHRLQADHLISAHFILLCGMQSPDGDTAQVPAQMASLLDIPLYPYLAGLADEPIQPAYRCLNPVGHQVVRPRRFPHVLTVTRLADDLPFHVSLADVLRAEGMEIVRMDAAGVGLRRGEVGLAGSRTRVVRIYPGRRRTGAGEVLRVDRDNFPHRAREMLGRLRETLRRPTPPPTPHPTEDAPDAPASPPYYTGPCLAVCETEPGGTRQRLAPVSLEVASRCARLAGQLEVPCEAVICIPAENPPTEEEVGEWAEQLRRTGAVTLHLVEYPGGGDSGGGLPGALRVREQALALVDLIAKRAPQVVVLPATLVGRVVAPYAAAKLDCGLTADCTDLVIADFERFDPAVGRRVRHGRVLHQIRPALGGNVMARIVSIYREGERRPQMATVRPGALGREEAPAAHCRVVRWKPTLPPHIPPGEPPSEDIELVPRPKDEEEFDLQDFEVVVCVGAGIGSGEAIERLVEPFRRQLERFLGRPVGLGCSRQVVERGWLGHSHQIGQTGTVVKPLLYLGLGVSGAVQHRIGMEGSRVVVSVNRDPACPLQEMADFAIVGDIEEVLPLLAAALEEFEKESAGRSAGRD